MEFVLAALALLLLARRRPPAVVTPAGDAAGAAPADAAATTDGEDVLMGVEPIPPQLDERGEFAPASTDWYGAFANSIESIPSMGRVQQEETYLDVTSEFTEDDPQAAEAAGL